MKCCYVVSLTAWLHYKLLKIIIEKWLQLGCACAETKHVLPRHFSPHYPMSLPAPLPTGLIHPQLVSPAENQPLLQPTPSIWLQVTSLHAQ